MLSFAFCFFNRIYLHVIDEYFVKKIAHFYMNRILLNCHIKAKENPPMRNVLHLHFTVLGDLCALFMLETFIFQELTAHDPDARSVMGCLCH